MAIVTLADVRAELPTVEIAPGTVPSEAQVERYMQQIEAETRALFAGCRSAATWPTDATSDQAIALKRVILVGVKYLTLDAKYTYTRGAMTPEALDRARTDYTEAKRSICGIAAGLAASAPLSEQATYYPVIHVQDGAPALSGSLHDWTLARDRDDGRLNRWGPYRAG